MVSALLKGQVLRGFPALQRCAAQLRRPGGLRQSPYLAPNGTVRCASAAPATYEATNGVQSQAPRFFADLSYYRQKAAITIKFIPPTFAGDQSSGVITVDRRGVALIEFANVLEGSGTSPGNRRYDWQRKQNIGLSAEEFAGVVEQLEQRIVHDPHKGNSSLEGKTFKQLQFNKSPSTQDWFLALTVRENGVEAGRFSIALNQNELAALRILAISVIPYLMGVDQVVGQTPRIHNRADTDAPF